MVHKACPLYVHMKATVATTPLVCLCAGNNFTGVWINGLAWVLTAQALAVLFNPRLTKSRPARFYAWCWYSAWMAACNVILLIGMHYRDLMSQYTWAFLWLPPIATIAAATVSQHRRHEAAKPANTYQQGSPASVPRVDVEAAPAADSPTRPCTPAAWRQCWVNYWAFVGWSSMFWLAFLVSLGTQQARSACSTTDSIRSSAVGQACRRHGADHCCHAPDMPCPMRSAVTQSQLPAQRHSLRGAPGTTFLIFFPACTNPQRVCRVNSPIVATPVRGVHAEGTSV